MGTIDLQIFSIPKWALKSLFMKSQRNKFNKKKVKLLISLIRKLCIGLSYFSYIKILFIFLEQNKSFKF